MLVTYKSISQNYWGSEFCPSSGIPKTKKHNVSETGCFRPQVMEKRELTLVLGPGHF
jgi:hypothetical protein